MKIVVGAPVRHRSWIIEPWFNHVDRCLQEASIDQKDVTYCFVGDHATDDTMERIDSICNGRGLEVHVIDYPSPEGDYTRRWGYERYIEMAEIRNLLLEQVRKFEPDFFWSLDSDILAAPQTLAMAIEATHEFDGVGTRCYMRPRGITSPSYMIFKRSGQIKRADSGNCFPVDVIMASKLMTSRAYNVNYEPHTQGEDVGWSLAAKSAGAALGWDGRTISKHVMAPADLHVFDARCGF